MSYTLKTKLHDLDRSAAAELHSPAFVIGCGRSGTTILGKMLALHPRVHYLNEPRQLWKQAFPESDIWSDEARRIGGILHLGKEHYETTKAHRLAMAFARELHITGKNLLIEKLPINAFRLELLDCIFPQAKYIYLLRNGLEVAHSIEKLADRGKWFGYGDYKWHLLVEYARQRDGLRELPGQCLSNFDRGLLEWRLSVEACTAFFGNLPAERLAQIRYDEFINNPSDVINSILKFLRLEPSREIDDVVNAEIQRRSKRLTSVDMTPRARTIGGEALMATVSRMDIAG